MEYIYKSDYMGRLVTEFHGKRLPYRDLGAASAVIKTFCENEKKKSKFPIAF